MHFEEVILIASILVILSILTIRISNRFGIPSLLFFLVIGMLAGSDGVGGIYFDNVRLAQEFGTVALAFILFSGGLETNWKTIRPAVGGAISLATVGVLITTLLVGVVAAFLLHIPLLQGLLLGAIISSTDAAAIFSTLGSQNLKLPTRTTSLLELESGCNDPMAIFLTIGLTQLVSNPETSIVSVLLLFVEQMGIGLLCGLIFGFIAGKLIPILHLEIEGLYPVLTIALVLFIFGVTALLQGSGFLAVYLAGLVLGNSSLNRQGDLARFHDGIAWLMQIALFLSLGLLVFPSQLPGVIWIGLLLAAFLLFIARPASTLIALVLTRMPFREKIFVSWGGLRGGVPIVLATFPLLAKIPAASLFFNIVFFIVLTSVLVQGTSLPFVGRKLGVILPPEKAA